MAAIGWAEHGEAVAASVKGEKTWAPLTGLDTVN
jgi:hypothetical protein